MDIWDTIRWAMEFVVVPAVTGALGYLGGRKKKDNDFLTDLQKSIDLLSAKNSDLMKQILTLNDTVVALRKENGELKAEVEELRRENKNLSDEVSQLRDQLKGVRTITKMSYADK